MRSEAAAALLQRTRSSNGVRRVVVGVDDSPSGLSALRWAVREAHARDVPLLALRAWAPRRELIDEAGEPLPEPAATGGRDAQEYAEHDLELASSQTGFNRVEQTARAVAGRPGQVLLDAAPGALLVVGSRGKGVLARHVLGSTTAEVLHHATSPVVVVPPELPSSGHQAPRVLVGVDHSPASLYALRVAAEAARRYGRPLVPVFAHQMPTGDLSGVGMYLSDPAPIHEAAREALWDAVAAAGCSDVVSAVEVLIGHAGHMLTTTARPQDLLVVGSRGRGGFTALLLGSTSTSCTQHSTCPVLVLREP